MNKAQRLMKLVTVAQAAQDYIKERDITLDRNSNKLSDLDDDIEIAAAIFIKERASAEDKAENILRACLANYYHLLAIDASHSR